MDPVTVTAELTAERADTLLLARDMLLGHADDELRATGELLDELLSQYQDACRQPILLDATDDDGERPISFDAFLSEYLQDDAHAYEITERLLRDGRAHRDPDDESSETYTLRDRAELVRQIRAHMAGPNRGDETAEIVGFDLTLLDTPAQDTEAR